MFHSFPPPASHPARHPTGRRCFIILLFTLCAAILSTLDAATFQAHLDSNVIFANEEATLSLTIQDAQPAVAPRPGRVPGLQFHAVPESHMERIVNGRRTTYLAYHYIIQAAGPGDYLIPSVRIRIAGRELATDPLQLKVLPAEIIDPQEQGAFVRLVAPRTDLFVGETMPIEVRLYYRHGSLRDMPQLQQEGLILGRLNQRPARRTRLAGIVYNLVSFESYISPARSGRLSLGPARLPMSLPVEGGPVDLFGRPLRSEEIFLYSPTISLDVVSLPEEGRPADFSGAVGDYSLAVAVSTNVVRAGDPITITFRISGGGPIEPLQLPSFDHWTGFRVYPPATRVSIADSFGLEGVKTFDQVVIPLSHKVQFIPSLSFSYFHPKSRSYRTLSHPATPITVQPAHPAIAQHPSSPTRDTTDDLLAHIKPRLGLQATTTSPLLARPWFLAIQTLPVAAWITALFWRRQQNRLTASPRMRRRRHVAKLTRKGISELRLHATRADVSAFFALLFRLLQEQLGEKLDRPASAITEAVLDNAGHLDPDLVKALRELFQLSNQTRFAPNSHMAELPSLLPRVIDLLRKLESYRAPHIN